MPSPTRAYRRPVPLGEIARRILRSMQEHAAGGTIRTLVDYTQRQEVCEAVLALMATEHVEERDRE